MDGPPRTIYEKRRDRQSMIRLGAAIVECFLKNMVEVWEIRNEDVHGKTKTEKQHKRKQKLAEQIRELQKKKEYVRPRDDRIFPEDPE